MPRTPLRHLVPAAGLASLLLLTAACGGSGDDSAEVISTAPATEPGEPATTEPVDGTPTTEGGADGSDPAHACTLLTADDATEALGEPAVPGHTQEADLCIWTDAADLRTVQVAILDESPDEWRSARQAADFEPVDGVGEEAWFGPVFDDLSFLVDGQVYEVDVELRGDGDSLEVATALAEVVVSRL